MVFSAAVLLLFEFTLYTYLGGFVLVWDCWCAADFWLLCCWLLYVAGLVVAFGLSAGWLCLYVEFTCGIGVYCGLFKFWLIGGY